MQVKWVDTVYEKQNLTSYYCRKMFHSCMEHASFNTKLVPAFLSCSEHLMAEGVVTWAAAGGSQKDRLYCPLTSSSADAACGSSARFSRAVLLHTTKVSLSL